LADDSRAPLARELNLDPGSREAAAPVPANLPNRDLPVRLVSAVVMLAVAGGALWIGGGLLDLFILLVAGACFAEFVMLAVKAAEGPVRWAAIVVGALYIGLAAISLISVKGVYVAMIVGLVACVDTGAYFTGRALGGPKIAPRISPSKTWAGLAGGMTAGALWLMLALLIMTYAFSDQNGAGSFRETFARGNYALAAAAGALLAITAQAGDFFESWLKRRAGVKDSSRLIPGHGGVFDRVDGLLPVAIIAAWLMSLT
jgi:phosphatidate cytidylyltransferase